MSESDAELPWSARQGSESEGEPIVHEKGLLMSDALTPQATAERAGVSLDTLRYYEREGLIGPIARTAGGHRAYGDDDLFWIGLVTCLRDAGLGISELREFTSLLRSEGSASDRVAFLQGHRRELQERKTRIDLALGVLDDKIAHYSEQSTDVHRG